MYDDSLNMKHIAFQQPFLWPSLRTTQFGVKTVTWLLAVPISHSEAEYAKREGWKRLETVFEEHQIDIFDLDRPSVI
jgi:hypothetical protein